jgi:hypothetical protein
MNEYEELIKTLKLRFEKNGDRHKDIQWEKVQERLELNKEKLRSLNEMEGSGGWIFRTKLTPQIRSIN